jgi:hypothetical protein
LAHGASHGKTREALEQPRRGGRDGVSSAPTGLIRNVRRFPRLTPCAALLTPLRAPNVSVCSACSASPRRKASSHPMGRYPKASPSCLHSPTEPRQLVFAFSASFSASLRLRGGRPPSTPRNVTGVQSGNRLHHRRLRRLTPQSNAAGPEIAFLIRVHSCPFVAKVVFPAEPVRRSVARPGTESATPRSRA